MVDKRIESEVTHAFIQFCDIAEDLGFRFESFGKIELIYCKGEASVSPHDMQNRMALCPDDFLKKCADDTILSTPITETEEVIAKKARQSQFL